MAARVRRAHPPSIRRIRRQPEVDEPGRPAPGVAHTPPRPPAVGGPIDLEAGLRSGRARRPPQRRPAGRRRLDEQAGRRTRCLGGFRSRQLRDAGSRLPFARMHTPEVRSPRRERCINVFGRPNLTPGDDRPGCAVVLRPLNMDVALGGRGRHWRPGQPRCAGGQGRRLRTAESADLEARRRHPSRRDDRQGGEHTPNQASRGKSHDVPRTWSAIPARCQPTPLPASDGDVPRDISARDPSPRGLARAGIKNKAHAGFRGGGRRGYLGSRNREFYPPVASTSVCPNRPNFFLSYRPKSVLPGRGIGDWRIGLSDEPLRPPRNPA